MAVGFLDPWAAVLGDFLSDWPAEPSVAPAPNTPDKVAVINVIVMFYGVRFGFREITEASGPPCAEKWLQMLALTLLFVFGFGFFPTHQLEAQRGLMICLWLHNYIITETHLSSSSIC